MPAHYDPVVAQAVSEAVANASCSKTGSPTGGSPGCPFWVSPAKAVRSAANPAARTRYYLNLIPRDGQRRFEYPPTTRE